MKKFKLPKNWGKIKLPKPTNCAFGYKKCIAIECSCWDYVVGECAIPKKEKQL